MFWTSSAIDERIESRAEHCGDSAILRRRDAMFASGLAILAIAGFFLFGGSKVGATRLVYKVDGDANKVASPLQQCLCDILDVAVLVKPAGDRHIEVIVASRDEDILDAAREAIRVAGVLRFLIIANPTDHAQLITLATAQANQNSATEVLTHDVIDLSGKVVGRWVKIARIGDQFHAGPLQIDVHETLIRDAATNALIEIPFGYRADSKTQIAEFLDSRRVESVEALMAVHPEIQVGGTEIINAESTVDPRGRPAVLLDLSASGGARLDALAASDPTLTHRRRLGLVLDDVLLFAPNISGPNSAETRIQCTNIWSLIHNNMTQQEIDSYLHVLRLGRLPASIHDSPISGSYIDMP